MNYDTEQKEFIKLVKGLSGSYSTYQVFSDFCTMAAISLYQPFAKDEALENEYMTIVKKYNKKEVSVFPQLLACVVHGLTARFGDFLGECYMELEISNKHQGQFFTPYYMSKFMSHIVGVSDKEKVSISEPAVGSGGIIIAYADVMKDQGINYQLKMEVQAVDTDKMCFHMTYIHLTLLHISAEVIWGNSLSLETFQTWYTPSNILNNGYRWGLKLSKVIKSVDAVKENEACIKDVPIHKSTFVQPSLF